MIMDITDKLTNWAKHSTAGQRAVILEARDEILLLRDTVNDMMSALECAIFYNDTGQHLPDTDLDAMSLEEVAEIIRSSLKKWSARND